ncbi:MAG: hypothetical protein HWN66_07975 [Candidatus Helarchaeota archaeon]|nr:hypothetical protein [Candidatus Helarchaeota archaeon]
MQKSRSRKPARERWINELSDKDLQKRIRILGSIIESDQDQKYAIVDDGTGRVQIVIKTSMPLKPGDQIRVFGILSKTEQNDYIIDAEIIQDMKDLDMELYKRVQEVKRRFREKSR